MTHMSWVTLQGKAHSFTELGKALHHDKAVSHEGDSFLSATKYTTHQWPQPTLENSIQFIYNMGKHKWTFGQPNTNIMGDLVQILLFWESSGSAVVTTQWFLCCGLGLIPDQGS